MNKEIREYIESQRTAGFTDEAIRNAMVQNGYQADALDQYFSVGPSEPPAPPLSSQTGAAGSAVQLENVQYNVDVKGYESKPAFIFRVANSSIAVGAFCSAFMVFILTGLVVGYSDREDLSHLQILIAVIIPLGIVAYIATRRLYALFESNPAAMEDIKYKAALRRSFRFFLILAILGCVVFIVNFIDMFIEWDDKSIQNLFFGLYFGGGLIAMAYWLYTLQKKTDR